MSEPLHRQSFRVHSYEVDEEGRLWPRALCAYLQEAAGGDATRGGYTMERLAEDGLVWVIQWMRVEIARYPRQGEGLEVTTWARRFDRAIAWRDYDARDGTGAPVAVGTSRWAVVDLAARRLARLPEFVRQAPFPDRSPALEREPAKLAAAEPPEIERRYEVRRSDLDTVRHVNNTRYVEWTLDAVPDETLARLRPTAFEIAFRKEAVWGDTVVARGRRQPGDERAFTHDVRDARTGSELARAASTWGPRD